MMLSMYLVAITLVGGQPKQAFDVEYHAKQFTSMQECKEFALSAEGLEAIKEGVRVIRDRSAKSNEPVSQVAVACHESTVGDEHHHDDHVTDPSGDKI